MPYTGGTKMQPATRLSGCAIILTIFLASCAASMYQPLPPYATFVYQNAASDGDGPSCWKRSLTASASETEYLLRADTAAGPFANSYQTRRARQRALWAITSFNLDQGWNRIIAGYCHAGDQIMIPNDDEATQRISNLCRSDLPISRAPDHAIGYAICTLRTVPVVTNW